MTFFGYIKDRVFPLLILCAAIAFVGLMVWSFGYTISAVVAVVVVLMGAVSAAAVWDYLSRRRFYFELKEALESDNETFYLTEFLRKPTFTEGQLAYAAIEDATKDMNDKIASYRRASEEYREYIETWIHEVKTPIAASRLTLSNNQKDAVTRPLERDLDRIEAYVEQALYYSRSAAVEKDYLIKQINLDAFIKAVVKKNSRALIEHGVSPHFGGLDVRVYSDPKWLEFIIGQLIANAIKYRRLRSDGHNPSITFSAKMDLSSFESETITLDITDNGIGIPQSDVARVFEKGFTGENGRRFARSTGIGLYICKKLCGKMKLKISAHSVEGEYTTISIRFPLSKMYFLK